MSDTHEPASSTSASGPAQIRYAVLTQWMKGFRGIVATFREVMDRIASHPIRDIIGQRKYYVGHLPSVKFEEDGVTADTLSVEECPICLRLFSEIQAQVDEDHEPDDSSHENRIVCLSTSCEHRFCQDDLSAWMERSNECPLCRTSIYTDEATIYSLFFSIVQNAGVVGYMRNAFDELNNTIRALGLRLQPGGDLSANIAPTTTPAPVETGQTEQVSEPCAEVDANETKSPINIDPARLEALKFLKAVEDFFNEISVDLSYTSGIMGETRIFDSFVVPIRIVVLPAAVSREDGRDAEEGGSNAESGDQ